MCHTEAINSKQLRLWLQKNKRFCPKCNSQHTKRNGHFRSKQRFLCKNCGRQFLSKSRKDILQKVLWKKYIWERQTARQLAARYGKSAKWIRQQLDEFQVRKKSFRSCDVVIVADMTFVKRTFGICVFRSPYLKKNLDWKMALTETANVYHEVRWRIERQGFKIQAAVIDGRPGIIDVFRDVPVQMCHFHQIAIMTRYLTARPKLTAGQILRHIALRIPKSNEDEMNRLLADWYKQWHIFLKEKTFNPITRRWFYAHKRLRSAYRSICRNLPLLYTYQKYPEFNIPNTTNSLDGTFSHLKDMLRIHRGLSKRKKLKMIDEILSK